MEKIFNIDKQRERERERERERIRIPGSKPTGLNGALVVFCRP